MRLEVDTGQMLDVLFAAAFSASAKSDLQQGSVVVVRDPAKRQAIQDLIPRMPWIGKAPVFMVWIGDSRRIRRICELRGKPFGNDHLDAFLNAATDAALAMQTFILAAEAKGLGCCPISALRSAPEGVSRLLGLPDHVFPVAGLAVGWPAQPVALSPRLPLALTLHENRYCEDGIEAAVARYDRSRSYAKQRDVARFGAAPVYGWSEDKARQYARPERAGFGAFVRAKGFKLD